MRIDQIWKDTFWLFFISIYYRSSDLFLCFALRPKKLTETAMQHSRHDAPVRFVMINSASRLLAISSRSCKRSCKVLFCTVNYTVCRVEFEIESEIKSVLETPPFGALVTIGYGCHWRKLLVMSCSKLAARLNLNQRQSVDYHHWSRKWSNRWWWCLVHHYVF